MKNVFFMHRIKHDKTKEDSAAWDKGIEVHAAESEDEAKASALQSYHAYLGAYGYGHNADIDFASCEITDGNGNNMIGETWNAPALPNAE